MCSCVQFSMVSGLWGVMPGCCLGAAWVLGFLGGQVGGCVDAWVLGCAEQDLSWFATWFGSGSHTVMLLNGRCARHIPPPPPTLTGSAATSSHTHTPVKNSGSRHRVGD